MGFTTWTLSVDVVVMDIVCVCVCACAVRQGINPIELGNVAVAEILRRFYSDFPPHEEEKKYNFTVSSSMKPTQVPPRPAHVHTCEPMGGSSADHGTGLGLAPSPRRQCSPCCDRTRPPFSSISVTVSEPPLGLPYRAAVLSCVWQVECARGSLNQIPPYCTFSGDIRLTPFYDIKELKAKVER